MGQRQTNTILLSQGWRCLVVFLVLVCAGCGTSSDETATLGDSAGDNSVTGVRVAFPRQDSSESVPHGVLRLTVTGPDIDTPVSTQQSFDLTDGSVVIELPAVPVGNNRVFTVEAFPEGSAFPNFLGETMANIPSSGTGVTVVVKMVPNVQGLYPVSGSETLKECSDEEDNGTFGASGIVNISSQHGATFSGTTSFSEPFSSVGDINGTVTADGEVSGTFNTMESDDTESEGTFGGTIVDGLLTITFSGMDTFLDVCEFVGNISGNSSTNLVTTVIGTVVNQEGIGISGANVTATGGLMDVTGPDGSFSIPNVPANMGSVAASAVFTTGEGSVLTGTSLPTPPVAFGATNVGTIELILPQEDTIVLQSEQFLIPEGFDTLRFEFNFLSNEFPDFVDSVFDDTSFSLLFTDGTIQEQVLASVNISAFLPADGSGFNGQTGFSTAAFDVSPFAGRHVQILFQVRDVGDSSLDSALLIDNIRLVDEDTGNEQMIPNGNFESGDFASFTVTSFVGTASDGNPISGVINSLGNVVASPEGSFMAILSTGPEACFSIAPEISDCQVDMVGPSLVGTTSVSSPTLGVDDEAWEDGDGQSSGKQIIVEFSENVDQITAEDVSNYRFISVDGRDYYTITSVVAEEPGGGNRFRVNFDFTDSRSETTNGIIDPGDTLVVSNVTDVAGNLIGDVNNALRLDDTPDGDNSSTYTVVSTTASVTIESVTCTFSGTLSDGSEIFDSVVTGTVSGPVGSKVTGRVESGRSLGGFTGTGCTASDWGVALDEFAACVRRFNDPPSSTFTVTIQALDARGLQDALAFVFFSGTEEERPGSTLRFSSIRLATTIEEEVVNCQ